MATTTALQYIDKLKQIISEIRPQDWDHTGYNNWLSYRNEHMPLNASINIEYNAQNLSIRDIMILSPNDLEQSIKITECTLLQHYSIEDPDDNQEDSYVAMHSVDLLLLNVLSIEKARQLVYHFILHEVDNMRKKQREIAEQEEKQLRKDNERTLLKIFNSETKKAED